MRKQVGALAAIATIGSILTLGSLGSGASATTPLPDDAPDDLIPVSTLEMPTTSQAPAPTDPPPTDPPPTDPAPTDPAPTDAPAATIDDVTDAPLPIEDLGQASRPGSTYQTDEPPPIPTTTIDPVFALISGSGEGRRVVYWKTAQRLWVFDEANELIKSHPVSGRLNWCDPKPGTYSVWSRSRYTNSINNPTITWGYMVRFAHGCRGGNIGFHEIPMQYGRRVQTVEQLGTPLSGGCVRQSIPDAIWMWNWAQLGTKVVVLQ